jgi:hypothetical protein
MVIGLQLVAFFLFLGYDCWGEWMDTYVASCLLSLFLFSHIRSLFLFLNNKRWYFIKTVLEGSLMFLCAVVVTKMSDLPPFFLA